MNQLSKIMVQALITFIAAGEVNAADGSSGAIQTNFNIAYSSAKSDPLRSLDIYAPANAKNCPVLVFIHGGGFTAGNKGQGKASYKPQFFTGKNYVFVSINYRLSPAVLYPVHEQDCADALGWVKQNITKYGGNPDKIFIMGHSAGANLAAALGIEDQLLVKHGMKPSELAGVILLDGGSYDLNGKINSGAPLETLTSVLGSTDHKLIKEASVTTYVTPGKKFPPFLLICRLMPNSQGQANELAGLLTSSNTKAEVVPVKLTHGEISSKLGDPSEPLTKIVSDFLDKL
jgi:arylformamidase